MGTGTKDMLQCCLLRGKCHFFQYHMIQGVLCYLPSSLFRLKSSIPFL